MQFVNEKHVHFTKHPIIIFISFFCSVEQKIWKNENRINISILKLSKVWVIYIVFNKQLSLAVGGVYT